MAYTTASGEWNMEKLKSMLSQSVLVEIAACLSPKGSPGGDVLVWSRATRGEFSTRTAYELVTGVDAQRSDNI